MKIAVAHSDSKKAEEAVLELINQCQTQIEIRNYQYSAALFFSNYGLKKYHQEMLALINQHFHNLSVVGCSSYAEICSTSKNGYYKPKSLLILIGSDSVKLHAGIITDIHENLETAPIVEKIRQTLSPKNLTARPACFIFPDYKVMNAKTLVAAFSEAIGNNVAIFGGAAADDNFELKGTQQFFNNQVYEHSVPFLILEGQFQYAFGVAKQGWNDVSGNYEPVETDGKTVLKVGTCSATDYLKKYLYEQFNLPSPYQAIVWTTLSVKSEGTDENVDILNVDTQNQTFMTNSPLPASAKVRLVLPFPNQMKQDVETSFFHILETFCRQNTLKLVLLFSCSARAKAFEDETYTQSTMEYEAIATTLNKFYRDNGLKTELPPIAGFYAHSEFAPIETGYHGGSLVIVLLGDKIENIRQQTLSRQLEYAIEQKQELQTQLQASENERQKLETELNQLKMTNSQSHANALLTMQLVSALFMSMIERDEIESKKETFKCLKKEHIAISCFSRLITEEFCQLTGRDDFVFEEKTLRKYIKKAQQCLNDHISKGKNH